jgi:hypothetical protein
MAAFLGIRLNFIYLVNFSLEIISEGKCCPSLKNHQIRPCFATLGIMTSMTPLSSAGFRAFPAEIRDMIYDFSNVLSWTGKTPALIVALRGDQGLYREFLELFYRKNTFTLHRANEWKTGDMSIAALKTIRALKVDFW